MVGLDHVHHILGSDSDRLELWNLGGGDILQGAVDEGRHLLGGFEPGPDCNLLQLSGRRLGPGQDGDGGNSDGGGLSWVVDDGQKEGLDHDRVQAGNTFQGVDSNRTDDGP